MSSPESVCSHEFFKSNNLYCKVFCLDFAQNVIIICAIAKIVTYHEFEYESQSVILNGASDGTDDGCDDGWSEIIAVGSLD